MDKMLTFKEKRYVENLMRGSKEHDPVMWSSWGGWVSFALGGFLIAYVCFLTASNLSTETVNSVLLPGILVGMVLLLGGYWIQHMSKKAQDDRILFDILKKMSK
jgi:amino acid transporter